MACRDRCGSATWQVVLLSVADASGAAEYWRILMGMEGETSGRHWIFFVMNITRECALVGQGICYVTRGFGVWSLEFDN